MTEHIAYCDQIWNTCLRLFQEGVAFALDFLNKQQNLEYHSRIPAREELAVNSRYLHRGFYCPSPIFDQITTNAKRGKLLKHPTKRSKITNRYCFDENGKLYLVEYISNHQLQYREYILQIGDVRYGFVFNIDGVLGGISAEIFYNHTLQSYMWATCYNSSSTGEDWQTKYVRYETHKYENRKLSCVNFHHVALIEDEYQKPSDVAKLVDLHKYYASERTIETDEPLQPQ